jgi:hypothetical protein
MCALPLITRAGELERRTLTLRVSAILLRCRPSKMSSSASLCGQAADCLARDALERGTPRMGFGQDVHALNHRNQ